MISDNDEIKALLSKIERHLRIISDIQQGIVWLAIPLLLGVLILVTFVINISRKM